MLLLTVYSPLHCESLLVESPQRIIHTLVWAILAPFYPLIYVLRLATLLLCLILSTFIELFKANTLSNLEKKKRSKSPPILLAQQRTAVGESDKLLNQTETFRPEKWSPSVKNLKDDPSLFLTCHHWQRSPLSSTNVVVKIWPCVYLSRSQTACLNPIHCHSCWNRV